MSGSLQQFRRSLAEEFGNIYETYGLSRLKGLIVGTLLANNGPMSLDEIAEQLGRSKGPISQTVRELTIAGIVRKATGEHTRRDYYTADGNLFLNNFRRNMRTVVKNRAAAEFFLGEMDRQGIEDDYLQGNLEEMRAFYALMEQFYARFEEEWEAARPSGKRS